MAIYIWLRREIRSTSRTRMRLIDMRALKRCYIVESIDNQMARTATATNKRKRMAGFKKVYIRKRWSMTNLK
jgi:hypothetical protein